MSLTDLLRTGPFLLDGGMGTLLQAKGLRPGEAPETWNLTHPEVIRGIHRDYYDAGSNMVCANTFGVHPLRYALSECEEMIRAALRCAEEAKRESAAPGDKYVALDLGPGGKLLKPLGPLPFEEAVRGFSQIVEIGARCGADCVFIETMNDSYETKAALLAAKESCSLPVLVSNAYGTDGKLMTGGTPESMTAMLEGLGADAVGVNCSLGPEALRPIVERYLKAASVPVLMKPNAGLPQSVDGRTVYNVGPEEFAAVLKDLVPKGLRIMGGCCGTTPDYIRALRDAVGTLMPPPLSEKQETVVSSRSRTVTLGVTPAMIGERINPTGKKRLRQALADGDMAYVLNEAISQEDHGADILDVNVGAPGIDEAAVLSAAVEELQAVTDLPLQVDTADPAAMERALRLYNGKAMINSVNGSRETMDAVFPLARKYGGVLVALTLDEQGIPPTPEGRLEIAERILAEAEKHGIARKNIVFDPLTMTVSADPQAARIKLDALRLIREKTGCGTVLGVSNVSFGLPGRELIGSAFLSLALETGLSAAIMNPCSAQMRSAFVSYLALTGKDPDFSGYITFASSALPVQGVSGADVQAALAPDKAEPRSLRHAVLKGLRQDAARLAGEALAAGQDGLSLVQNEIIPALDEVGRGFEAKTLYLPQLMMSAEAADAAFRCLKEHMTAQASQENRCRIVLATVRGDVHDIGKNIVRLILENYGYQVTDLGRDVSPEAVLDAVLELQAPLCGLSALMTTTVPAMAETIDLIHRKAPFCKVMVGGAVLTEAYAGEIHADGYARDAMAAVRVAERLTGADQSTRQE